MTVNWGHGLTFIVGFILGLIIGVLFFADDADAAVRAAWAVAMLGR